MNTTKSFIIAMLTLFLCNCSHYYTPRPSLTLDQIPEFSSTKTIMLVNGQPSREQVIFIRARGHRWYANLHEWTSTAITIAERELTKRGIIVVNNTQETLLMSIESVHTEMGFAIIETEVVMRVQTGSGYTASYVGKNKNIMGAITQHHIDGVVMRVVAEMFKDPEIMVYLTQ